MAPTRGRYTLKGDKGRQSGTRRGLRSQQRDPSIQGIIDVVGTVEVEGDKEEESIKVVYDGGPDLLQQAAIPVTRIEPKLPSAGVLSLDAQLGARTTCTMVPIVEVSDITMPPSSINLVGFGDEYSCEHIDIPQGVKHSYVSLLPHVKVVSAETATTLLRQIAGLTSIAMEQSLKARDKILRLKRAHEAEMKAKEVQIAHLEKGIVRKGNFNCGSPFHTCVSGNLNVDKQDGRMTGFTSFADGETSKELCINEFMTDDSSEEDGDGSTGDRVLRWLPSNAAGWATNYGKMDDNGCAGEGIPIDK